MYVSRVSTIQDNNLSSNLTSNWLGNLNVVRPTGHCGLDAFSPSLILSMVSKVCESGQMWLSIIQNLTSSYLRSPTLVMLSNYCVLLLFPLSPQIIINFMVQSTDLTIQFFIIRLINQLQGPNRKNSRPRSYRKDWGSIFSQWVHVSLVVTKF